MSEIMTAQQAAAYLQLAPETIRRYARRGRLPAARIGGHYRIRKADLDALFGEERVVDRFMAEQAQERMATGGPSIPLEQVMARLRARRAQSPPH